MNDTPPITTRVLAKKLPAKDVPMIVRLRDGTEWRLDGVSDLRNERHELVAFSLQVGPREDPK